MSKLVIAGGLEFVGTEDDFLAIKKIVEDYSITEIVSGTARGADQFGEQCAKRLNLSITRFPADWDNLSVPGAIIKYTRYGKPYNAAAGPNRNEQMACYTDFVHTFPDIGRGTQSMRNFAIKYHKPLV